MRRPAASALCYWTEQAKRQLLRTIPRDLCQQVTNLGIAKALQQGFDVLLQHQPARRGQRWQDVFLHERTHEAMECRIVDCLGHRFEAGQTADVGERRMRTVQQTQLGALESADVVRYIDAQR